MEYASAKVPFSFEDYLRNFIQTATGRIIVSNAIVGAEIGLYSFEEIKEIFNQAYERLTSAIDITHENFIEKLRAVCEERGWFGPQKPVAEHEYTETFFCAVWDARAPWDWLLPTGSWKKIIPWNPVIPPPALRGSGISNRGEWFSRLAGCSEEERSFALQRGKTIGRKFFWYTPYSECSAIVEKVDLKDKATLIRDMLGLVQHQSGACLILYKIPGEVLTQSGVRHARPTFAEALSKTCTRFSVKARDSSVSEHDPFGRTVNLGVLKNKGLLADGVRERVCRAITEQECGERKICLVLLGEVTEDCGAGKDNDEFFSQKLAEPKTDIELHNQLSGGCRV